MRSVVSITGVPPSVFVAEFLAIGVLSSSVSARGVNGLPVGKPHWQVRAGAFTGGVKTVGGVPSVADLCCADWPDEAPLDTPSDAGALVLQRLFSPRTD